ncbi:FAD-dependent oxidoreductase [Culicoidibacter larvae]|uniref:NADH oxidase n=1 Tax=Culicoidibacter larvae TaxID=2579976 RepID=A0A5R8QA13_9FIRM|nr:FAD-dependent oxidoreductase [Culicoidibacter larvae]TLG72465.1 NADH oxidase [Culicoidibacter larvae]
MKVVVIGCTHAGTAAILNIKANHADAQITVYERNDNISFLSCGIALYVGGVVEDPQGLFYSSPEQLAELGVVTNMEHDVLHVDVEAKTVEVKDLKTGEVSIDTFDKLVVTTGSWPVTIDVEGKDLENILFCKNYNHAKAIIEAAKHVESVAVVGGGYIGIELVEAFAQQGKKVTLIDRAPMIMAKYFDKEFLEPVEKTLVDHGIKLALCENVVRFEGENGNVKTVVTDKGSYDADLVISCVGFKPNTGLLKGQVKMLANGAIIVDDYMRTSNPDVFAAGDSCIVHYNPTGGFEYIPLATNAVRMGTLVGRNLVEPTTKYIGTQSTSGIKVYEHNMAATGLTEENAHCYGMDVKTSTLVDSYRPEFMPTHEQLMIKLVYDAKTRVILGGQISSAIDLTPVINTLSVCIQKKVTVDELAFIDFFFQPHYNKPWNFLNTVAMQAE